MGRNKTLYSTKMKLSLALLAAAQAYPTQWAVQQSTLDLPIQQLEEVVNFFKLNLNFKSFPTVREAIDAIDDSQWQLLWDFCNVDGDDEASHDEMITCFETAADYYQMPETMQNFSFKYTLITWFCTWDKDRSGGLSYEEFLNTFGFHSFKFGLVLLAYDHDKNGLIDEDEAEIWENFVVKQSYIEKYWRRVLYGESSWEITDKQRACLESAKYSSKDQQL